MSGFKEYPQFDAIGLVDLIRNREISTNELIEEAISRIEKANPILNVVVTKLYDDAKFVIDSNLPDGPFTGVPFFIERVRPVRWRTKYIRKPNISLRTFVNKIARWYIVIKKAG